jgi:protein-tyrosine phosphatase
MNLLFVCSKNKWRSRTAEAIFKNTPGHQVRSAGTDPGSEIKLTEKHLSWADLIFVMEKKHMQIIRDEFGELYDKSKIVLLDIPDEYQYMDEDLILNLKNGVSPYVGNI